jgi:ComF family protein
MPLADAAGPCPYCHGEGLYPFGQILRLCVYADPVRQLVHALKFHRAWTIGEFLADRLHQRDDVCGVLRRADVVVPVPLHPLRQVERGYDQAEVIARRLARLARRPVRRAAARLVTTTAQTDVRSRSERIENLRHAFGLIDPSAVVGRRVVVVDDVRTTAATLQSFGRCLRQGKPASIDAVVVAVADPRHADFQSI